MPNPATVRERRLRKTKAQLIDEIDRLEQRAAAIEADLSALREHKTEVLAILREEERDRIEERSAIIQFDAYASPRQTAFLGGIFAKNDVTTPWRNEPIRAGFMVGWKKCPSRPKVRVGSCADLQRPQKYRRLSARNETFGRG